MATSWKSRLNIRRWAIDCSKDYWSLAPPFFKGPFDEASGILQHAAQNLTSEGPDGRLLRASLQQVMAELAHLTMLPVVLENGSIAYKNVTVPLEVTENADGVVTITAGTVTAVAAPTPVVDAFKAGTYYGPSSSATSPSQVFVLAGPGLTTDGSTEWSVAASPTAKGCTYPYSATFYVVSSLTSSPLYSRLKAAGITSNDYSYGILGSYSCEGRWWSSGALVGFSQIGNTISVVSFSDGSDYSTPQAQITFTY